MLNQSVRKIINVDSANLIPLYTFKQEDDAVLLLSLFRNSVPLDITGQTVTLGIKRPNGTLVNLETLEVDNPFTIDSNNLDIKLKNSVLTIPGLLECDLELVDVNGKMTTASFYITVNRKIISDTNIKATNDIAILEKIKLEEETREANETNRKESEIARVSAEELRDQQETVRGRNEANREEAESIRNNQETIRINNEITREEQENSREFNEATRNESENSRLLKEGERTTAEKTRNTNEETRKSNENSRIEAEKVRASQEDIRKSNEVTRNSNESTRQTKEQERISSEETRKANELARQTAYKEIEGARKDFSGVVRDNLNERLAYDIGYVNDRFNKASLLDYEGRYISAVKSYDGVTRDLKIKGKTLQNLIPKFSDSGWSNNSYVTKTSNAIVVNKTDTGATAFGISKRYFSHLFKPSTIYTLICDVSNNTISGGSGMAICHSYQGVMLGAKALAIPTGFNGRFVGKFTSISSFDTLDRYEINFSTGTTGTIQISDLLILEGDYTNENPKYFEGIRSVGEEGKLDVVSCGKNLFDKEKFVNLCIKTNPTRATRVKFDGKDCLKLTTGSLEANYLFSSTTKSSTIKLLAYSTETTPKSCGFFNNYLEAGANAWKNNVQSANKNSFTIYNYQNAIVYIDLDSVQIEEGTLETSYEPYKETRIPITITAHLRSLPNGVCDEIDLEKGKIFRRIGKTTLDGSENWIVSRADSLTIVYTIGNFISNSNKKDVVCDIFNGSWVENFVDGFESIKLNNSQLFINILKNKLSTQDVAGFKTWLQSNPVTVYYELATPIEEPLISPNNLRTYDNITNIFTEGSLIEPNVYCKIPSDVIALTDIRNSTVKNKIFANADERVEELEQDIKNIVTQEAWITPTLLNGWMKHDSEPKYFKDTLGFVHLKGNLKSGILDTKAFILPAGYRPSNTTRVSIASDTYGRITIASDGSIIIYAGSNIFCLDGIIFKAEQ